MVAAAALGVVALILVGCGEPASEAAPQLAPLQPNRSSELAEAMRAMDAELVELLAAHAGNPDAWEGAAFTRMDLTRMMPTDSTMLVDGYQAFAMAFHAHVEAFNAQPSATTYSNVVNGCLSCHQRACPGPIERINKRQLD